MADTDIRANSDRNDETTGIDTGAPVPVTVEYVEAQLNELWRDVADAAQAKGGVQAVTMAQVLNLVIRSESYNTANSYIEAIDYITGRHPCRVISMITDPDEGDMPVQAWVSIHCQLPPAGGRNVCCEQVSVAAGGEAMRQLPAAVIPLLLPDLPVFLWWPRGAPFDDYLYRNLTDSLNRLIVDSATFENSEGTLAAMYQRMNSSWPKIAYTDMNWGRMTHWREMVASFFDSPSIRPYLDRIGNVAIEYSLSDRGEANRAQAMLTAGWLASRLGWEPVDPVYQLSRADGDRPGMVNLQMRSGKRPINITLSAGTQRTKVAGNLHSIKLQVPGQDPAGSPEAEFEVALSDEEPDCAWTCLTMSGAEQVKRNVQMDTPSTPELLHNELEVFSHDRVYEDALQMVGTFIRGTGRTARTQESSPRKITTGEPISAGGLQNRPEVGKPKPPQPQ